MGISLSQYRYAIGSFRALSRYCNSERRISSMSNEFLLVLSHNFHCEIDDENRFRKHVKDINNINTVLYFIIILYIYIFIELAAVSMPLFYHSPNTFVQNFFRTSLKTNCLIVNLPHVNRMLLQTFFKLISSYFYYDKQSALKHGLNSMCEFCSVSLVIYLCSINIILVVFSNMTLLNPGTVCKREISVYYQNIQGLIPFTHINSKNPPLNLTKLAELHTHVAFNKPDIVIVNETWLKENIGSKEIFPFPNYKIFRLGRSPFSHPPDEIDKRNFKSNGGGVLIAVNSDVVTNHKVIKSNSRTEVLSISFDIAWRKKICITTCYRVGTLGHDNVNEISKHINMISNTKSIKSHILVGDFNLNAVSWDQLSSTIKLQNDFLIMFENNCLTQMISQPTHYLGNVLDMLLTDKPSIISNLNIGGHKEVVSSDHYPISFHVLTTHKKS